MAGAINSTNAAHAYETIVVGAGLAGLSAACHLGEEDILILEQAPLPGGRIRTRKAGAVCFDVGAVLSYDRECAPPGFSPPAPIQESGPIGLFFDGKLHLGESVMACLGTIFQEDPGALSSMLAAGDGTLGLHQLTQRQYDLLNAFFQVIHPGDIEEYLPAFYSHAFASYCPRHYPDGNHGLIQALSQRTAGQILCDAAVIGVERTGELVRVSFRKDGHIHDAHARSVIVATPAPVAASLVSGLDESCRRFLQSVRYGRYTIVALAFDRFSSSRDFSYIVTPDLPMSLIYKMTFPGNRTTVLLVFYCNRASRETWTLTDDQMIARTRADLARAGLNLEGTEQLFAEVHRWEHGGTIIAPETYAAWDEDAVCAARGIYLAGDYLHRDFPYGMDAAVKSGVAAARRVGRFLQQARHHGISIPDNEKPLKPASPPGQCFRRLVTLAQEARWRPIAMTCIPPEPQAPFPYGDLVPLGFLLRALRVFADQDEAAALIAGLEAFLARNKKGNLWAFHSGHLITATDSALVLLGLDDIKAVEALEIFYDGRDGYYPQLWSREPRPGSMQLTGNVRHWCQRDYSTTCLVRGLRMHNGLPLSTSLEYLEQGFEQRSGLYFTNPYLVDWALALAIRQDEDADGLRHRLIREVCASQNSDASFGMFDKALSTALAVLTLADLDYAGDRIVRAQGWLEQELDRRPVPEKPIPFYSSDLLDENRLSFQDLLHIQALNGERMAKVENTYHLVSYYEDTTGTIVSAMTALALSAAAQGSPAAEETGDRQPAGQDCHPRYRCRTRAEYIARFALPPYVRSKCPMLP